VGDKYEKGDLFLSELMYVGHLASEVTNLLEPHLIDAEIELRGKIIIGAVEGDVHDIGKNIVIMMLKSSGFQVVDLGVDISAEKFVEAIKNEEPDVLCMSALLTSTMSEMQIVMDALERSSLRSRVKVMVGGRPITSEFSREIGADGYAEDAVKAIRVVKKLMGRKGNN
jgi:5-methyltetrahydrofolate--homocysteine methyltransferase